MSFIEEFAGLKFFLFRYVFCQNLAKLVIFVPYFHTLLLSESCNGIVLFGSNLSKFRSKNLKASLMSSTCALFFDKARCFSQSESALYVNFTIIVQKKSQHHHRDLNKSVMLCSFRGYRVFNRDYVRL